MTMRQPRKAKEFASAWQRGIQPDQLFSGQTENATFPDAQRRQDRLIGLVVNTMMELYVYEELKEGHNLEMLIRTGILQPEEGLAEKVQTIRKLPDADTRNEALMGLVMELTDQGKIKTHRNLVPDATWDKYKTPRENFNAAQEHYEQEYAAWNEAGSRGPMPRLDMEKPQDPRVASVNEITRKWVALVDSGPKPRASLESKLRRKGYQEGKDFKGTAEIRDMSRVLITPDTPEVTEDFLQLLSHHLPAKEHEHGKSFPRVYKEPWGVTPYGYFDHKTLIALDRLSESDTSECSQGLHGMIGEIKVVPKEMLHAEKVTSPVYSVLRELSDSNRFMPDSQSTKNSGRYEAERNKLMLTYEKQKAKYMTLCEQERLPLKQFPFPELKQKQLNRPDTYTTLANQLTELQQNINAYYLSSAGAEWTRTYLFTAFYQQAGTNPKTQEAKARQKAEEKVTMPPPSTFLSKIAAAHDLDASAIQRKAYEQWQREHPRQAKTVQR